MATDTPKKGSQLASVTPDPATDSVYVVREVGASKSSVTSPVAAFANAAQGADAVVARALAESSYQQSDDPQFVASLSPALLMAYNGRSVTSGYKLGLAHSMDGRSWTRETFPFLNTVAATWEADILASPRLVRVDDVIYCFYWGFRNSTLKGQIGLAVSRDRGRTWVKDVNNPVIANGGSGSFDEIRIQVFEPFYDPEEVNAAKRWKGWGLVQGAASAVQTIAYYYAAAPEGPWTHWGRVLDVGPAGSVDADTLDGLCVNRINGTYYLFYGGYNTPSGTPQIVESCLATFTDPEGLYTKQGRILRGLVEKQQNLTANALAGDDTVLVSNSAVFQVNENVMVAGSTTGNGNVHHTRVKSLPDATHVVLTGKLPLDMLTANSAAIRSAFARGNYPKQVFREDGHWTMGVTIFMVWRDSGWSYTSEQIGWARCDSDLPTGPWTFDIERGVALPLINGTLDQISSENPSILMMPSSRLTDSVAFGETTSQKTSILAKRVIFTGKPSFTGKGLVSASGTALTGSGSSWTSELERGDRVTLTTTSGAEIVSATAIASDTGATVSPALAGTATLVAGTILPAAMRIDNSAGVGLLVVQDNGNVGLGTMAPAYNWEVVGTAKVSGAMIVGGALTAQNTLDVTGNLTAATLRATGAGTSAAPSLALAPNYGFYLVGGTVPTLSVNNSGVFAWDSATIYDLSNTGGLALGASSDVLLRRGGGASPNGTLTLSTGNATRWTWDASGNLLPVTDGAVNVGSAAARVGQVHTRRTLPAQVTLAYSAAMSIDTSLGEQFIVTPTDNVAFGFNSPTNGLAGQDISITIFNTTGGALGALSGWGGQYKMTGAWTQPANGFNRSITFRRINSAWYEQWRNTADVPN